MSKIAIASNLTAICLGVGTHSGLRAEFQSLRKRVTTRLFLDPSKRFFGVRTFLFQLKLWPLVHSRKLTYFSGFSGEVKYKQDRRGVEWRKSAKIVIVNIYIDTFDIYICIFFNN